MPDRNAPAILILLPLLLAAVLPSPAAGREELTYSGSQTIALSVLFEGGISAFERRGGVPFSRVSTEGGSRQGIADLLEGKTILAGSLRPLTPEEKGKGLVETAIGFDRVAVWVNRDNPVNGLSRGQLRALLGGKARNWKEVGGADLAVKVFLAPPGTRTVAQDLVGANLLGGEPFLSDPALVPLPQDQLREVSLGMGGICMTSMGLVGNLDPTTIAGVKPLSIDGVSPSREHPRAEDYPLSSTLFLVTKGPPSGSVKGFIDFILSSEGQAVVARNFLPLSPRTPSPGEGRGDLTYAGSKTIAIAILFNGALSRFEKETGARFSHLDLSLGGQRGVEKVAKGEVSVAGIARPLRPEELAEGLVEFPIARDAIGFWVNRDNPVSSLRAGQVKDILTGKTRNWKEVGGPDLPIDLFLAAPNTRASTRDVVEKVLLKGERYRDDPRLVSVPTDQLQEISRAPGGFCMTGLAEQFSLEPSLAQQVKPLALDGVSPSRASVISGKYPLTHPFMLVTKGPPVGNLKLFIDFMLSPMGREIVEKEFVLPVP